MPSEKKGITLPKAIKKETPLLVPMPAYVPIREAARSSGVSARMVRHYETQGLLLGVTRTHAGYRQYSSSDIHTLHFIRRARNLGFSIDEIRSLIELWRNQQRNSAQVKYIVQRHICALNERIAAMQAMQRTLQTLVSHCRGDDLPDCPIIDDLASPENRNTG